MHRQTNSTQWTGSSEGAQGMPSWSSQPGDRRTCGQVWCPNNGDVRHLGRGTNPERLPGGGGAALKGEEERVCSRCVCTYWGHDGGGEKQRQRKQQQALRHLVSPNTGTGVTRRSPRIRENQNPCSASRGPAPALCSSPQWRQGLWGPLAWSTACLSLLGLSFDPCVRSPGGWHHTSPTGDQAQCLARGPQWVLFQTRLGRTHTPDSCFKGPGLEQLCVHKCRRPAVTGK